MSVHEDLRRVWDGLSREEALDRYLHQGDDPGSPYCKWAWEFFARFSRVTPKSEFVAAHLSDEALLTLGQRKLLPKEVLREIRIEVQKRFPVTPSDGVVKQLGNGRFPKGNMRAEIKELIRSHWADEEVLQAVRWLELPRGGRSLWRRSSRRDWHLLKDYFYPKFKEGQGVRDMVSRRISKAGGDPAYSYSIHLAMIVEAADLGARVKPTTAREDIRMAADKSLERFWRLADKGIIKPRWCINLNREKIDGKFATKEEAIQAAADALKEASGVDLKAYRPNVRFDPLLRKKSLVGFRVKVEGTLHEVIVYMQ